MQMKRLLALIMVTLVWRTTPTSGELTITHVDADGLTWTNSVSAATYSVLMAATLSSSWDEVSVGTNQFYTGIASTNSSAFFRVRWTDVPSVLHTNVDEGIPFDGELLLDLNGDANTDLRLRHQNLSTLEGDGYSDIVYAKSYRVCLAPFPSGKPIRMDISPETWVDASGYEGRVLAERQTIEGPWTYGPWAGVANAHLPLQFTISNVIHLGWVNLSPLTNGTWRVHSAAYRPAPETMLRAGE